MRLLRHGLRFKIVPFETVPFETVLFEIVPFEIVPFEIVPREIMVETDTRRAARARKVAKPLDFPATTSIGSSASVGAVSVG